MQNPFTTQQRDDPTILKIVSKSNRWALFQPIYSGHCSSPAVPGTVPAHLFRALLQPSSSRHCCSPAISGTVAAQLFRALLQPSSSRLALVRLSLYKYAYIKYRNVYVSYLTYNVKYITYNITIPACLSIDVPIPGRWYPFQCHWNGYQ